MAKGNHLRRACQKKIFLRVSFVRMAVVYLLFFSTFLPITIQAQEMTSFIFPFSIDIDPMERLLLVNFEKDPDTTYIGFEPQVFDDEINGKGHLVIGWRKDGRVDVYHESTLSIRPGKYDIAGKGLAESRMTHFDAAHFTVAESGVHVHYAFTDLFGREVQIRIEEKHEKTRKPFDLLAPMGDAAENPSSMPLVMLFDFYFVRKKGTAFDILIDGKRHQPDGMPLPLDGARIFFTRYSPRPLIATLNPNFKGEMIPIHRALDELVVSDAQHEFFFIEIEGYVSLERLNAINPVAPLEMLFDPPFLDIQRIPSDTTINGKFKILSKPEAGYVEGVYSIASQDNNIHILLIPSDGWIPKPDRFFLRFLYRVAKPFRNWPKSYQWEAKLVKEGGSYHMTSEWKRIE